LPFCLLLSSYMSSEKGSLRFTGDLPRLTL
jgi:hypothetical protein